MTPRTSSGRAPRCAPRLVAALAAVLVLWLASALPGRALAQDGAPQAPAVTVATVTPAEFHQRVAISGSVVAREEVLVYSEVAGYAVIKIAAEVNDHISKGDVLARLNGTVLSQKLAQAESALARARTQVQSATTQIAANEARLDQADATLERQQSLRESGTVTQSSLDEAVASQASARATLDASRDAVNTAKAQLREAQVTRDLAALDLERAVIKAPVSGIVTERNVKIGAIVSSAGDPLFRILRDGEVDIEADVIETDLPGVKPGDPAQLDIAGLPGLAGTVRRIDPTIDPATRLGTVVIEPDAADSLRPGLYAGGWITTATRTGLAVPASAVLNDDAGDYVFTVQDDVIARRDVTVGLLWQGQREVLDGLTEGDVVVARAGAFFSPGDAIRPILPETAPAATE